MRKKLLSALLVFCMALTLLPTWALAVGPVTVTLDGNGGVNARGEATEEVVFERDTMLTFADYPFTRSGYKLVGWIESEYNSFTIEDTYYINTYGYTDNKMTLTAVWAQAASDQIVLYGPSYGSYLTESEDVTYVVHTISNPLPAKLYRHDYSEDKFIQDIPVVAWGTADARALGYEEPAGVWFMPGEPLTAAQLGGAEKLYVVTPETGSTTYLRYHLADGSIAVRKESGNNASLLTGENTPAPTGKSLVGWTVGNTTYDVKEIRYPTMSLEGMDQIIDLYPVWEEKILTNGEFAKILYDAVVEASNGDWKYTEAMDGAVNEGVEPGSYYYVDPSDPNYQAYCFYQYYSLGKRYNNDNRSFCAPQDCYRGDAANALSKWLVAGKPDVLPEEDRESNGTSYPYVGTVLCRGVMSLRENGKFGISYDANEDNRLRYSDVDWAAFKAAFAGYAGMEPDDVDRTVQTAPSVYTITVDGISFQSDSGDRSGEGWRWFSNGTLTLNGYRGGAISSTGRLHINVSSNTENTVTGKGSGVPGIFAANGVSISSSIGAKLTVRGGSGAKGGHGIESGAVWIYGESTSPISISGGKGTERGGYGIFCGNNSSNPYLTGNVVVTAGKGPRSVALKMCYSYAKLTVREETTEIVENSRGRIETHYKDYTITLDGNGGACGDESKIVITDSFSEMIHLADYSFTKPGSFCVGWKFVETTNGNQTERTVGADEDYYPDSYPTATTLKAQWDEAGANAIVLMSGNYQFEGGKTYAKFSDKATLPKKVYLNYGTTYQREYDVTYWSTSYQQTSDENSVLSGKIYFPGETVQNTGNETLFLYPSTNRNSFHIYHHGDGSFNNGSEKLLQYRSAAMIDDSYINAPAGKELQGWKLRSTGAVYNVGVRDVPAGDLDPVWQAAGTVQKLAAPSNLSWGVDYRWTTGSQDNGSGVARPGMMSWKINSPTQNKYGVQLYRAGDDEKSLKGVRWNLNSTYIPERWSDALCIEEPLESGTYYFTVQAIGDYTNYRSSEVVRSENWTYTAPAAQLSAPVKLTWSGSTMTWNAVNNGQNVAGYYVEIQAWDKDQNKWIFCGSTVEYRGNLSAEVYDYALQNGGDTDYRFAVRAISKDITTIRTGELSNWSEPRSFTEKRPELADVTTQLNNATTEEAKKEAAKEAVETLKNVDAKELAESMLVDTANTETVQLIEQLEELTDSRATVAVAQDAPQELKDVVGNESEIKVVGAGLNAEEEGQRVELKISKPEAAAVIPEQYTNAVQVSMDLIGTDEFGEEQNLTEAHQPLAVPVKISMPIPAGINPNFLVILHHHADGSVDEVILPKIDYKDGKAYATFVLRSFSTFTFATCSVNVDEKAGVVTVVPTANDKTATCCAVYSSTGQMLGISDTLVDGAFEVRCNTADVARVKVFWLSESYAPLDEATEYDLTAQP